jgi:hypothetical protein
MISWIILRGMKEGRPASTIPSTLPSNIDSKTRTQLIAARDDILFKGNTFSCPDCGLLAQCKAQHILVGCNATKGQNRINSLLSSIENTQEHPWKEVSQIEPAERLKLLLGLARAENQTGTSEVQR